MSNEEELKKGKARLKTEYAGLIANVQKAVDAEEYDEALEAIAILNVNVIGMTVIDSVLQGAIK